MFGMGLQELIMIFILALIIFGPKKMPELAKTLGKFFGSFKRAAEDIKNDISFQINLDEEKKALDDKYRQLEQEAKEMEKKQ
jgi:Tat protein translocase TatB subunit